MTFIPEAAKCLTTSAQRIDTETETETFVATCFDPTQVTSRTNRSNCNGDTAALAAKGRPPHIAFHLTQDPIHSVESTPAISRTSTGTPIVASVMRVRRLTPTECERLQGFPDGHTAIPKAKDGPRYAALGNSMAVPVMRWIGERIAKVDSILEAA